MNSELIALLAQTSLIRAGLSAYLIDSKVLTIQSSTTAASAARLLARNRIRSAPVVDEDGKYAGLDLNIIFINFLHRLLCFD